MTTALVAAPPLVAVAWAHDIGASLREGFFMFWVTLWPLVLGFTLSGAVQAFVPKKSMARAMGCLLYTSTSPRD